MEWTDEAIVLGAQRQGESSLIVTLLARAHGRHKGLVRGGQRSRQRGIFEPGTRVTATWQARLEDHLGLLKLEPGFGTAALILDDPVRLGCLEAATGLLDLVLPEREAHPVAYQDLAALLQALAADSGWGLRHLDLERHLLADLGFGLDLATCAVTGATTDLAWVSPRTGRAVAEAAAGQYRDRLLRLPHLFGGPDRALGDRADLSEALGLTGYFLERLVLGPRDRPLPTARARYLERLGRLPSSVPPKD
jgi:DNA repair protein RecO (recombination protein O)